MILGKFCAKCDEEQPLALGSGIKGSFKIALVACEKCNTLFIKYIDERPARIYFQAKPSNLTKTS